MDQWIAGELVFTSNMQLSNLWKVDDDRVTVVGDHDVELVEVAVNDPVVGKLKEKIDEPVVKSTRIVDLKNIKIFKKF